MLIHALIAAISLSQTPTILTPSAAHARSFDFSGQPSNRIALTVAAPLHDIIGSASTVQGTARFDPNRPQATIGALTVPVRSISFGNAGYTQAARAGLSESEFPNLTCALKKVVSGRIVRPGEYEGRVLVDFTMRGVTRPLVIPLFVRHEKRPDGAERLFVRTSFVIHRSEFGVAPQIPAEVASDDVTIQISLTGAAKRAR